MIDAKENELCNNVLDTQAYKMYTPELLAAWTSAFKETPPARVNLFGIVDVERYDPEVGILFIGRETNDWKDADFCEGKWFRQWLCRMTKCGGRDMDFTRNMWYNIGRWAMLLQNPDADLAQLAALKSEVLPAIGTIAFTNINKVRGKAQCGKKFWTLAKNPITGTVLQREIEILQPKIVVCCGTKWIFDQHVPDYPGKVVDMPHPGARKNKQEMLLRLKAQL